MKAKLVVPREHARQDVEDALAYYMAEDAEVAAVGFVDVMEPISAAIRPPARRGMRMN